MSSSNCVRLTESLFQGRLHTPERRSPRYQGDAPTLSKAYSLILDLFIVGLRYRNAFKGRPNIAYKRPTKRYDGEAPYSIGFSINETWGALKRCWRGYRIAKKDGDGKLMKLYAKRVRKLEFELGIGIAEFPDIGLFGDAEEDVELACD